MGALHENLISPEQAGTLDGLLVERVRRSPGREAYAYFDKDARHWQTYTW